MHNRFSLLEAKNFSDEKIIVFALNKNSDALEEIIRRYQSWIFNIALRMVMDPQDAEDVTQEVLFKIISKLSTFNGKSKFSTWVYRIIANHVINMKKRTREKMYVSFDVYENMIDNMPLRDIPDQSSFQFDLSLVLEEIKIDCFIGMILCLNREQRLIFILGEILGIGNTIGSEIFGISKCNYRQKLFRARKKVFGV